MKQTKSPMAVPEIASYTKYYEHDGTLRAYANRAMLLAMIFGMIAMTSLGFAIYVRLQPPTVIRVDKNGDATVVGAAKHGPIRLFEFSAEATSEAAPTDLEGRARVKEFLEQYLSYTPDTVGKIKDNHIISDFAIRSIDHVKGTPWTYLVFGVKEIHEMHKGTETTDRIVGRYTVRLVEDRRTLDNPSGLLVAEYREQQMVGDRETGLLQHSDLEMPSADQQQ